MGVCDCARVLRSAVSSGFSLVVLTHLSCLCFIVTVYDKQNKQISKTCTLQVLCSPLCSIREVIRRAVDTRKKSLEP